MYPQNRRFTTANTLTGGAASAATFDDEDSLSPLEVKVLDEYEKLARLMKQLAVLTNELAAAPVSQIVDGLRHLERSTSVVHTLLKASVYSIVLQQGIEYDDGGSGLGGGINDKKMTPDDGNQFSGR